MATLSLLVIGLGTLHDLECAWFPSSAFLWRRCALLDRDKLSRPDIVADIRKLDLDLPQSRFDVITTAYGIHGEILEENDSFRVCVNAFRNVHHMLKPAGLFVCYLSDRSIAAMSRSRGVSNRQVLDVFSAEVDVEVPLFFDRIHRSKSRKVFAESFAKAFFNSSEKQEVCETLDDMSKNYVLLRKKDHRLADVGDPER